MNVQEKALIIAAQQGNKSCFEEIYKRYYQYVYALAFTTVGNSVTAEKILKKVFADIWVNLKELREISTFLVRLLHLTLSECYNIMNSGDKDGVVFPDEDKTEIELPVPKSEEELLIPEAYAERADLSDKLTKIIDNLSMVQRQSLVLFYYCGLTVQETAQVTGCGEGTVQTRLYLARCCVRNWIKEHEKKTGVSYYGIKGASMLPFKDYYNGQVIRTVISGERAQQCFAGIFEAYSNKASETVLQNAQPSAQFDNYAPAPAYVGQQEAQAPADAYKPRKMQTPVKILIAVLSVLAIMIVITAVILINGIANSGSNKSNKKKTPVEITLAATTAPQTKAAEQTTPVTQAQQETAPQMQTETEPQTEPDNRQQIFEAYSAVLDRYSSNPGEKSYYTYDIDRNGTVELIVDTRYPHSERKCEVYTFDDQSENAVLAGIIPVGNGGLIDSPDIGLVYTNGENEVYQYNKVTMNDKKIGFEYLPDPIPFENEQFIIAFPMNDRESLRNAVFG